MRLVSFDPFRTLGIPGVRYIKPDRYLEHLDEIRAADWLLFPEYWQVNALHYAEGKRVFPSMASYHLGHDKIEMTRALTSRWPEHLPATLVLASTPGNRDQVLDTLGLPLVAKEARSSEGRGVQLIGDEAQWQRYCDSRGVLYAQEYLPIDRDLRIVVIGRHVVAGYWRVQPPGGFLNNVAAGGSLAFDPVPRSAIRLVTRVARTLGIDHAGFDVAMVGDHPYLLEFNRLFGNSGLAEQGVRPAEHIARYLHARSPRGRPRRGGRGRRVA